MSIELEVAMNQLARLQEHEAIMRLADDYADATAEENIMLGSPSEKRRELYDALWKALKL